MTDNKRRIDACLRACAGISTQNLEDNVPVLELARRYNVVLRERDALRAKSERMEKRLRLILEAPENTMSESKAMREIPRQARLTLEESK